MKTLLIQRNIGKPDALEALHAACQTALGIKFVSLWTDYVNVVATLDDSADVNDQNSITQLIQSFDVNTRTPAQTARTQAALDLAALIAQAQTLISQCNTGETDCDTDRTNLAAAGSLATVKPIVDNMLVRQKQTLVGLEKVIRGLLILNS